MAVQRYDALSVSHKKNRFGFQYPGNKVIADNQDQTLENMNGNDRMSNTKSGMSRLEQLRMGYQERLLQEKEQKLNQLFQRQTATSLRRVNKPRSGGTVREFFAERRALESTEYARKHPETLPPIQHHFKKVKEQKQLQQGQYVEKVGTTARIGPGRREIKSISAPAYARRSTYQRPKPRAGIDRQNLLPSLTTENNKQELVYSHFETESSLIDSAKQEKLQKTFSPHPPVERKMMDTKNPQRPVSQSPSDVSVDDMKLHMPETPPKLSRLKQLRAKRLSQTTIGSSEVSSNKNKTDFQKWQLEQDEARAQRLAKHRLTNQSESSDLSISQQERDILEKLNREKEKLDQIQREKDEMEEQQRKEREEEERWLVYQKELDKKAEKMEREKEQMEREKMEKERKRKELSDKSNKLKSLTKKKQTKKAESPIVKIENNFNTGEDEDVVIDQEQENYFKSYYEIQANTAPSAEEEHVDLSPCSICGRNFATERLAKHVNVCAKNSQKKRKVFDQRKMRMEGTDMEQYIGKKDLGEPTKPVKKSNWRTQHETFIQNIRYAKGSSDQPPPVAENPDYVQCPHCNRKFNDAAAERHIPRCKDIKAKPTFLKRKK